MPETFSQLLVHIIFSTKRRAPTIDGEIRSDLFAYLGGIIREIGGKAVSVGGAKDHVHLLVEVPPSVSVAELMRVVKANSSRWVHEKWPNRRGFGWQAGYAAFAVSKSKAREVVQYILQQEKHHQRVSFRTEYISFLKKHGIPYDERFVFEE